MSRIRSFGIYLRTERQSFRLLPKTKSVVFTVRTRVTPLSKVIQSVDEASLLLHHLRVLNPDDNSSKGEFRNEVIDWLQHKFSLDI